MKKNDIIRPINLQDDLVDVIELWYESSISAHDFIESSFWESSKEVMRELYIPMSKTMVLELDGRIIGFISIFENKLAALFVSSEEHGRGFGKNLLQWAFANYDSLSLTVYEKNVHAISFYEKNGFVIKERAPDPQTGEPEWTMEWRKYNDIHN